MVKRTFQPHSLRRKRTHGFRSRKRKVLKSRRGKGRWRLGL